MRHQRMNMSLLTRMLEKKTVEFRLFYMILNSHQIEMNGIKLVQNFNIADEYGERRKTERNCWRIYIIFIWINKTKIC